MLQKSLHLPEERQFVLESQNTEQESVKDDEKEQAMFERLGYKQMTLDIFNSIRYVGKLGIQLC